MTTKWYPALCSALLVGCGGSSDNNGSAGGSGNVDAGYPTGGASVGGFSAAPVYGMLVTGGNGTAGSNASSPTGGRWTGGTSGIDAGVPTGGRATGGGFPIIYTGGMYGISIGGRPTTGGTPNIGGAATGGASTFPPLGGSSSIDTGVPTGGRGTGGMFVGTGGSKYGMGGTPFNTGGRTAATTVTGGSGTGGASSTGGAT